MKPDRLALPPGVHAWPTASLAQARAAAVRAERYLRERQSGNGGFCFYRWLGVEEPSLHDTWHAVATFVLLGIEVPRRDDVVAFLRGFRLTGFGDLYHQALALDRLGHAASVTASSLDRIHALDATTALANEHVSVSARLRSALCIVVLQRHFAAIRAPDVIVDRLTALRHDGGWGDKPNLGDSWLALAVLGECGERAHDDETRDFVDALQVASFGFTATRDSMYANLDIVHAGIRACRILELPLRQPGDALSFVLACQCGDGGFALTSDALPNIGLTHRGMLALVTADALPVRDVEAARRDHGE